MKVTTEQLPHRQVKLTVEVESAQVDKSMRQVARRLSRQIRIPGFRPGKAPFSVIERRFGREALLEEVVEKEGQDWYEQALEQAELEPYGQAQLEVTSHDPLTMTFTLPVEPVVELGEYHHIRVEWALPSIGDEDVENELARLQQEKATLEAVERPAEMEDVATLDVQARIGDELVVDLSERAITLNPGINYPVAGFAEKIVDMTPGQDREFTLTYPEDHPNAAWAGKEAHFTVHLHSLRTWIAPELDDQLAKIMGQYETLDEWRADVRQTLEAEVLHQAEHDYADRTVDALVEQAYIEYPAVLVERELDSMMQDMDQSLKQRGLGLENFLVMTGQSQEDYRESLRETAEKRVKRGLALAELVKVEALEVTETEIDDDIARMLEELGDEAENLHQLFAREEMRASIRSNLLSRAAVDTLKAIGRGEYEPQVAPEPEEEREVEEELSQETETSETAEAPEKDIANETLPNENLDSDESSA